MDAHDAQGGRAEDGVGVDRRELLAKLPVGLAGAGAAWVAPSILRLSVASAQGTLPGPSLSSQSAVNPPDQSSLSQSQSAPILSSQVAP